MRTWIAAASVIALVVGVLWIVMHYVGRLRTWKGALGGTCSACLLGGAIGSVMLYIATEHNPQGAYVSHATGAINSAALAEIFLSWFVVVSVVTGLIVALIAWPWTD